MDTVRKHAAFAVVVATLIGACGGKIGSPVTVGDEDGGPLTGPHRIDASVGPPGFDASIAPPLPDGTIIGVFDVSPPPGQPDVGLTSKDASVDLDGTLPIDVSVQPPVDAGCTPTLPSGFTASPKGTATPACTAAQIAGTVQNCFLEGASDQSCEPYAQGPCWACIQTPSTATNWGAYIDFTSDFADVNYGGCIARLDPTPAGQKCGSAYAEFEQCLDQACVASCPPDPSSTNPYQALQTCEDDASGVTCATYQDAEEVACASEGTVANTCSMLLGYVGNAPDGGEATQITGYITAICGLPDGGM
jgi:hypothetical protein